MKIDFEQIRELLAVVSETDIAELTIESGDEKVTVKKQSSLPGLPAAAASTGSVLQQQLPSRDIEQPSSQPIDMSVEASDNTLVPIACPMVGTFYRSSSPSAPPFIELGDRITVGQTVCIIEAMKLMNDLPSEVAGKIVRICVENGTTVEYGQALFMVDPSV